MSDPVKSTEIENVLASIRRLVSEEAHSETQVRRQAAAEQSAPQPEPEDDDLPAPDALVLTPALRVHEGGRSTPVEAPDAATSEAPAPTDDVPDALAEAEPMAAIESVPEPDTAALASQPEPVAEADLTEPEAEVEDLPEPPSETPTLEAKIAALEALISGSIDSRQKTAPEPAAQPEPTPADLATEVSADELPDDAEALAWEDHLPQGETENPIAEPAEDQGETDVTVETAEDIAEAAHRAPAVADEAPTIAEQDSAETAAEIAADNLTDPDEAPGAEPVTIDEAMLRDMVTDIVRQELQGALGERITRNVRRLVRREIHRALASHDLD